LNSKNPIVNDVVYVEGVVGNLYLEGGADLGLYKKIFSRLRSIALSSEESIALVTRIAAPYT
jgi:hypothetical protein